MALADFLSQLQDPRSPLGRRYPLVPLLLHTVVAILGGAQGPTAIAQYGRDRGSAFGRALGYDRDTLPCAATFCLLFQVLDVATLERLVGQWLGQRLPGPPLTTALDGKVLKGSRAGAVPALHLLALYAPHAGVTLAQVPVPASTNEHKTALVLLDLLPAQGVVTGDAAFCQKDLCRKVEEKKGSMCGVLKTTNPPCWRRVHARSTTWRELRPPSKRGTAGKRQEW